MLNLYKSVSKLSQRQNKAAIGEFLFNDLTSKEFLINSAHASLDHNLSFEIFSILNSRQCFTSAQKVSETVDFNTCSWIEKLKIIENGYHTNFGYVSDKRLTNNFLNSTLVGLEPKEIIYFLKILELSDTNDDIKHGSLEKLRTIYRPTTGSMVGMELDYYEWLINLRHSSPSKLPDSVNYRLKKFQSSEQSMRFTKVLLRYLPYINDLASPGLGEMLVEKTLTKRPRSHKDIIRLARHTTGSFILRSFTLDELREVVGNSPEVFAFRTKDPTDLLTSDLISHGLSYWLGGLENEDHPIRRDGKVANRVIGSMLENQMFEEAGRLSSVLNLSNTFQQIELGTAYSKFLQDSYGDASKLFEDVVREAPGIKLAWSGLRYSYTRIGSDFRYIESIRNQVGMGKYTKGKPGADYALMTSDIVTLRQMQGDYTRPPLKTTSPSWNQISEFLQEKWFDFGDFPASWVDKKILIVPIAGVSDEIRAAYEYRELDQVRAQVDVLCDPRLQTLFENSFPSLKFVSFSRAIKIRYLKDRRNDIWNDAPPLLANYIPGSIGEKIHEYDIVTTPENLVMRRMFMQKVKLNTGPYIVPNTESKDFSVTNRLKVGFLWRSHLTFGVRAWMFPKVEDYAPILSIAEIDFVCMQHELTPKEIHFLSGFDNVEFSSVDLFQDFDGIAALASNLDLIIGLSTFPIELAAAVGIPTWMLGFSPENFYIRTAGGKSRNDQLTANSEIIAPYVPRFWQPRHKCVEETVKVARDRLLDLLENFNLGRSF